MGVIEFKLDGTIVGANDRFLAAVGYTQDEIRGQHHRLFVKPEDAARRECQDFWDALASGVVMPDIMRKTLTWISETRSKVFIPDISGVPSVDTAVANQLIKITKSTRLMGCETIISGLSPAIAQTMVTLGVDVSAVRTTAALRDAFRLALRQVGGLARLGLERDAGAPGGNGSASQ